MPIAMEQVERLAALGAGLATTIDHDTCFEAVRTAKSLTGATCSSLGLVNAGTEIIKWQSVAGKRWTRSKATGCPSTRGCVAGWSDTDTAGAAAT